jgi:serine/threonine protein kinase/tetratricopeptide (TPR) repeat protein
VDTGHVKEVFAAALEVGGAARAAYLDSACASDAGLRAEVESLLAASESSDALLGPRPGGDEGGAPPPVPLREGPGAVVGNYRLIRQIGEGGFGVVFLAEQERPVRRRVALKVVKLGMDTRQVVARFELERQALAMMDHPHIAKVLDAGATESGRTFFVTELVPGVPVTAFCDREGLGVRQRLELFLLICHAIAHAHQKGIIHRDIKPGNVLVERADGVPAPKVIDFGVARSTRAPLMGATVLTEARQIVGTLEYMSPEQADPAGAGVDTRGDVYSLGALLYELLAGAPPIDRASLGGDATYLDLLRTIREVDPVPPSVRRRRAHPERGAVPSELDWVVMRCLEKDRERRYPSVSALADDVGRFLRDEPVQAGPSTPGYRLRKFVARHRTTVAAAALVTLAVVAAVAGTTAGLLRARAAQRQAEQNLDRARSEAARAGAVTTFLGDVFSLAESGVGSGGEDASARDVLRRAAGRIDTTLADRPREQVVARRLLAHGCERMFLYDLAAEELRKACDTADLPAAALDQPHRLDLRADWALAMYFARRGAEASPAADAILRECRRTLGESHPVTWEALQARALCASQVGDGSQAYGLLQRLVEVTRPEPAAHRGSRLGRYLCNWSAALRDHGEPDAASAALREAAPILLADLSADGVPAATESPTAPAGAAMPGADPWPVAERPSDPVDDGGWIARELLEGGIPEALPLIEKLIERAMARHPQGTPTISFRLEDAANLRLRNGDRAGAAAALARAISISPKPRGADGGADSTRWRLLTVRCAPGLAPGWRSEALRAQVWCALDDLLRDHPPPRLAAGEVFVEQLRFILSRWDYDSDSAVPLAAGGWAELRAMEQPPAGTYLLGLEVPRLGADPLRRADWLLLQPWTTTFRPVVRFDGLRTENSPSDRDWTAVVGAPPGAARDSFGLAMQDGLSDAAAPHRIQWFTADAVARVELPAGRYRLSVTSDDGSRLFVDGARVLNAWRPRPSGTLDAELQLSAGPHELRVEFFQETGGYCLRVQLAPLTAAARSAAAERGGGVPGPEYLAGWFGQLRRDWPHNAFIKAEHGRWLAAAGRFQDAAEAYDAAVDQDSTNLRWWQQRVTLLAWLGNDDYHQGEYRRAARALFDRFGGTADPTAVARNLICCGLRDHVPVPGQAYRELLARADAANAEGPDRPLLKLAQGIARVRLGDHEAAGAALRQALDLLPPESCDLRLAATSFLAIANEARGAHEEAAAARAAGDRIVRLESRQPGLDDINLAGFEDWLTGHTAWGEASTPALAARPDSHPSVPARTAETPP